MFIHIKNNSFFLLIATLPNEHAHTMNCHNHCPQFFFFCTLNMQLWTVGITASNSHSTEFSTLLVCMCSFPLLCSYTCGYSFDLSFRLSCLFPLNLLQISYTSEWEKSTINVSSMNFRTHNSLWFHALSHCERQSKVDIKTNIIKLRSGKPWHLSNHWFQLQKYSKCCRFAVYLNLRSYANWPLCGQKTKNKQKNIASWYVSVWMKT